MVLGEPPFTFNGSTFRLAVACTSGRSARAQVGADGTPTVLAHHRVEAATDSVPQQDKRLAHHIAVAHVISQHRARDLRHDSRARSLPSPASRGGWRRGVRWG